MSRGPADSAPRHNGSLAHLQRAANPDLRGRIFSHLDINGLLIQLDHSNEADQNEGRDSLNLNESGPT